jgi:hypothetical protein
LADVTPSDSSRVYGKYSHHHDAAKGAGMADGTNPLAEEVLTAEVVEVIATGTGPTVSPAKSPLENRLAARRDASGSSWAGHGVSLM